MYRFCGIGFLAAGFFCALVSRATAAFPFQNVPFVPVQSSLMAAYNGPGQSADYARKVVVSQSGRIYWMGQSINVGVQNGMFIRCYQADGTLLWSDFREINGFLAHDLLVDQADNAIVVGQVFSNSGLASSHDVGLLKYNAQGVSARPNVYELDYIEPVINPFYNQNAPTAAVLGTNGILYISGYVSDESFGEPSIISHPVMFAVNTAGSMSLEWTSSSHGAISSSPYAQEIPAGIARSSSGDLFEVSNFGTQGNGVTLRRVSASGDLVWTDSATITNFSSRRHQAVNVGVDALGAVYVTGRVETSPGVDEVFVAKFNPADGSVSRLNTFRFGERSRVKTARVLPDGSVVGAGSINFDQEWLVFRIGNEGNLLWDQRYDLDSAYAMTVDSNQNIYVAGTVPGIPSRIAAVKYSPFGQILWAKTEESLEGMPDNEKRPPAITFDNDGAVFITGHRNFDESSPDEGGSTYPIFDAAFYKIKPSTHEPPQVRFVTPSEGQKISSSSPFPKITLTASSPVGIQKIAIYNRRGSIMAVLTNAPYEITLPGNAELGSIPLYAIAYDNSGYAGIAQVAIGIEFPEALIEFSAATYRTAESSGSVRITARRNTLLGRSTVTVTMSPATASTADFNYFGETGPFDLVFIDGENTAEATIQIDKDTLPEPNETFTLELSNPSHGKLGAVKSATVTIIDDDSGIANPAGRVGFGEFSYLVSEDAGQVEMSLVRTGGSDGPVSVNYFTQPFQPISARPNADYLEMRGTVHFGAGETNKSLTAYVLKDNETESFESFYVTLIEPENGATMGQKSFTIIQIRQNQAPTNPPSITTIDQWTKSHFTVAEQANPAISGESADPDGDGIPNVVEYAMGSNPKEASSRNFLQSKIIFVDGKSGLEVRLTRPKGLLDVNYLFIAIYQIGSAVCGSCVQTFVTDNGNGTETLRLQLLMPVGENSSGFLDFKVERK